MGIIEDIMNRIADGFKVYPRMSLSMIRVVVGTSIPSHIIREALSILTTEGIIKPASASITTHTDTHKTYNFYEVIK